MDWQFEWRRTWTEVWSEDFQQHWRDVLAASLQADVFHQPEVIRSWAETYGDVVGAQPCFGIATHSTGNQVLVLWIVVNYQGRLGQRRVLEPAGQSYFGYHRLLVTERHQGQIDWPSFWLAVRSALADICDQALLPYVGEEQGQGVFSEPASEQNPVLNLEGVGDLAALLERCSANHRGDVRRRLRRISECGDVSLWIPGNMEIDAAQADFVERFLPAYDEIWRERPAGNMFNRPGVLDFAKRVLVEGLASGWAHYSVLRIAGEPVAWHLGLIDKGQLYWWIPTHAPSWNDWSPGKVLLAKLIEQGIAAGWTHLHFQTGGHDYKLAWANTDANLRTIRWQSPTLKGKVLSFYDSLMAVRTSGTKA